MLEVNTILVPVDFSERSAPAAKHAVNIAKHFNAQVAFLHVTPVLPYDAAFASGFPAGFFWTPGPDLVRGLRERLDQFLDDAIPGHPGERMVVTGRPVPLIGETARSLGADMIVMPTSGVSPFQHFLLGSVTTGVLGSVDSPVFTGAHVEDVDVFAPRPYKRIGCAIGLQSDDESLLRYATDFASAYRAEVVAIHAMPMVLEDGGGSTLVPQLTTLLRKHAMERTADLLKRVGAEVPLFVEPGAPEDVVSSVADTHGLDLVVIGRHKKDGAFGGLRGNAYNIIRNASCPIISV